MTPLSREALTQRGFTDSGPLGALGWTRDLKTEGDANAQILVSNVWPNNCPAVSLMVGGYTVGFLSDTGDGLVSVERLDVILDLLDGCWVDSHLGYEKDMEPAAGTPS